MKKITFLFITLMSIFFFSSTDIYASSYLTDKMEEVVNIDVSGAEALCQTDDGYVWIAQYSGLTRYDSREFKVYQSFTEGGKTYDIINARKLTNYGNDLYILTKDDIFKYSNNTFSHIDINDDSLELLDFDLDKTNNLLYICSDKGLIIYDINKNTSMIVEQTIDIRIIDVTVDEKRNRYFYVIYDGAYDNLNQKIYDSSNMIEIYSYDDTMLFCLTDGVIRYDLNNNSVATMQYDMITDHVNTAIYSEKDKMVYIGCDTVGIYCINELGEYQIADNLVNKTEIVDLMVDYEGNLWFASHDTSSSGVSFITKNALLNLLYDDDVWQSDKYKNASKIVYGLERYNDKLYICLAKTGLLVYDLNQNMIVPENDDNDITKKLREYFVDNGLEEKNDFRDVEYFNGKLYFANYGIGLVEYDLETNNLVVYDIDYLNDTNNIISKIDSTGTFQNMDLVNLRCLRAFDDFLVCGYQSGGVYKFKDGKISIIHTDKSTLFINKSENNEVLFNHTGGIFKVSQNFNSLEEFETEKDISGNRLKFLAEDNRIYYNLNGRFFYLEEVNGNAINKEIIIPYIKGSIVEIAKIRVINSNGNEEYKYIIASQTQIYVTDSLDDYNIDSQGRLKNYEIFDSTNGLKTIQSNTSGYYDSESSKYYFQTTDGIFVYDFNESKAQSIPTKIAVNSINVDGKQFYGNDLKLEKDTYRIEINLSIFGFKPNTGYTIFYKLDGVDNDYITMSDDSTMISYTNLSGGSYKFHVYALDSNGVVSNQIDIDIVKEKHVYEFVWFWVLIVILALILIGIANFIYINRRIKRGKERESELKGITIESIEAIARTIDVKDTYTNGHSIRVGHYSRTIAEALGMEGDELENLYYIALLHDIGKIGIPDAILNKPGRLDDKEFEIMRSHTTKGAKILKDISTIPNIVEGAKYHHERYGGGGYPEGLKGEDIPYIARIICCADCFDAMATRRVYKDPYPKEKIISEFERCKETQFDPKIADVVIKLIKEGKLKAE